MENQSTYEFLAGIDRDLLVYVEELEAKAFLSTKTLKYLREDDLDFALPAHKHLILAHARLIPEQQK